MNGKRIIPVNKENNIIIIDQTLILFSIFFFHLFINSINIQYSDAENVSERARPRPNGEGKSKEKE